MSPNPVFSNPKTDNPIFYGDNSEDFVTVKFMYNHILIAQATYHWSNPATAKILNFHSKVKQFIGSTTPKTQEE
jgi:hypothetical protein